MCPVDPSTTTAAMEAFAQSITSAGVSLDSLSSTASTSPLSSSPANDLTLSVLLPMTVGTALCSASAASFNELIEAPYDAQMARTRARPLPRRHLTPLHVATFGYFNRFDRSCHFIRYQSFSWFNWIRYHPSLSSTLHHHQTSFSL